MNQRVTVAKCKRMMKSLTISCPKSIINKHNDVGFSCFKNLSLNRAQVWLIPSKDVARINFFHLLSPQQHRRLQPVLSLPDSQVDLETTGTQPEQEIPSKTINVKFQLQKECSFGDHFFMVGDHFMLGSWDPENAIPLTWSEGHVWAVELDIPVGTSIQFKFILKTRTGVLLWQPDPDRIFESLKTKNTIVVCEDWEDAEHQRVIEEEPIIADQDEPRLDSETGIVTENLSTMKVEELVPDVNLTSPGEEQLQALSEESVTGNGEPSLQKPLAVVAENISHPTEDLVENTDDGGVGSKGINCPEDETLDISNKNVMVADNIGDIDKVATVDLEANLVPHEGNSPVLVPGLSPLSTVSTEEAMLSVDEKHGATEEAVLNVDEKQNATDEAMLSVDEKQSATEEAMLIVDEKNCPTDASIGFNEASNDKLSELEEKQAPEGEPWEEETTPVAKAKEEQLNQHSQEPLVAKAEEEELNQHIQEPVGTEEEQPDLETLQSNVFQSDVQWGRKTLKKFFDSFRFP